MKNKASKISLMSQSVKAGFPTPAEDYVEDKMDLNEYIVKHPASTFFVRASGNSMKNIGIGDGDLLVVDKSLEAKDSSIVIASINSEFTVKRVKKIRGGLYLVPESEEFQPIKISSEDDFLIWGVVTTVIKNL